MIRDLRTIRLTRPQFVGLVLLSVLSSVLIIAKATGQQDGTSGSQLLALLRRGPIIHRFDDVPAGSGSASGSGAARGASGGASSGSGSGAGAPLSSGSAPSGTAGSAGSAGSGSPGGGSSVTHPTASSQVKHVFIIDLTTTSYAAAFGRGSVASYLNGRLRAQGTVLSGYRSLAASELPDELAMVSGQAPTPDTRANCADYSDFPASAKPNKAGLVGGNGCVYPNTAITLGDQVTASGADWRAYIEGMGARTTCIHPNSGARDDALLPFASDQYDTRHNPFIYFHSLLDLGDCTTDDMDLTALPKALLSAAKTARLTYLAPALCDDAASAACPNGAPGGLAGEDAFLKTWVPRILASPAYRQSGVLMIVFAPSRPAASSSGAMGTSGVGATTGTTGTSGAGATTGATGTTGPAFTPVATSASAKPIRTGLLILSPFARRGRMMAGAYDPYSVLRSIEDLFGFAPLGHAGRARSFVSQALPRA